MEGDGGVYDDGILAGMLEEEDYEEEYEEDEEYDDDIDGYHERMAALLRGGHQFYVEPDPSAPTAVPASAAPDAGATAAGGRAGRSKAPTYSYLHKKSVADVLDYIEYYNSADMAKASVNRLYKPKQPDAAAGSAPGATAAAAQGRAGARAQAAQSLHSTFLHRRAAEQRHRTMSRENVRRHEETWSPKRYGHNRKLTEEEVEQLAQRLASSNATFDKKTCKYVADRILKQPLCASNYSTYIRLPQRARDAIHDRVGASKVPRGPWKTKVWKPAGTQSLHRYERERDLELLHEAEDDTPVERGPVLTKDEEKEMARRMTEGERYFKRTGAEYWLGKLEETPRCAANDQLYESLPSKLKELLPKKGGAPQGGDGGGGDGGGCNTWEAGHAPWKPSGILTQGEAEFHRDADLRKKPRPQAKKSAPAASYTPSVSQLGTASMKAKTREKAKTDISGRFWK